MQWQSIISTLCQGAAVHVTIADEVGVSDEAIEAARDGDDPKHDLVALILSR